MQPAGRFVALADGLADGAAAHGAAADDVAGGDAAVLGGARNDFAPAVIGVDRLAVAQPVVAVDAGVAFQVQPAVLDVRQQFVGGDDPGADGRCRVLAFGRAEAESHFVKLQIPGAPVVKDAETGDVLESVAGGHIAPGPPDDAADFQLVVQLVGRRRIRHGLARPVDDQRVGEVENGHPIPDGVNLPRALRGGVFLIDDVIADGRRLQHRGAQPDLVQSNGRGGGAGGQRIADAIHGVVVQLQQGAHIGQGMRRADEGGDIHDGISAAQHAATGAGSGVVG